MSMLSAVAKRKTMATIRSRNGVLYIDYSYESKRIQRSTGFKDTKENRKILEKEIVPELMKKIYLGELKKPDAKRFSHYHKKFMIIHESDKSFHSRVGVYNKVDKFFGNMFVRDIKAITVKEYLASLDLRSSTKKDYLGCIRGTLDIAIDDEEIDRNVAYGIRFKREAKAPIRPFSIDEVNLMLEKAEGMFRNYIGISLNSGLRSGEVLGLMHSDILDDRITVRRSVSKGRITSPKTLGSVRNIPMFEALKPFIEDQRRRSESLYLFDCDKTFIKDASFFKRRWHQLVKDCKMEYRKLYSTRHTFITAMLNSGKFKIMEIAAIVGHTSPEMIVKNYAGFLKDDHLKVDTNVELFNGSCCNSVTVKKLSDLKNA